MQKIAFWILIIAASASVLGYSIYACLKARDYLRLDAKGEVQSIQWSILPLSDEEYVPIASYSFKAGEKIYQGEMRWIEVYLNNWAAQEAVMRLEHTPPRWVWYDSTSPEFSSLRKDFPTKEAAYAGLLSLLALYFAGLGIYVKRRL